jgi:hypothetical protein
MDLAVCVTIGKRPERTTTYFLRTSEAQGVDDGHFFALCLEREISHARATWADAILNMTTIVVHITTTSLLRALTTVRST